MTEQLEKQAAEFRQQNNLSPDGYVLFHEGEPCGWVKTLDHPQGWVPSCIALSADGEVFVAVGGNDQDGAREWIRQQ